MPEQPSPTEHLISGLYDEILQVTDGIGVGGASTVEIATYLYSPTQYLDGIQRLARDMFMFQLKPMLKFILEDSGYTVRHSTELEQETYYNASNEYHCTFPQLVIVNDQSEVLLGISAPNPEIKNNMRPHVRKVMDDLLPEGIISPHLPVIPIDLKIITKNHLFSTKEIYREAIEYASQSGMSVLDAITQKAIAYMQPPRVQAKVLRQLVTQLDEIEVDYELSEFIKTEYEFADALGNDGY